MSTLRYVLHGSVRRQPIITALEQAGRRVDPDIRNVPSLEISTDQTTEDRETVRTIIRDALAEQHQPTDVHFADE